MANGRWLMLMANADRESQIGRRVADAGRSAIQRVTELPSNCDLDPGRNLALLRDLKQDLSLTFEMTELDGLESTRVSQ